MRMKTLEGIVIRELKPVNHDDKGLIYEWCKGVLGMQVSIFHRKKGGIFANHYHTGADPSKSPDRFFIVKGRARLSATDGEKKMTTTVREGQEVLIDPYIYHTFVALTDFVFIEYRATTFDKAKPDAFDRKSFEEYLKRKQS